MASDETPDHGARAESIEHRSILLDLGKLRPPVTFDDGALVNEIAPEGDPPGSLIHTYHGVQSIAVRRLMGYYRHLFSAEIKNRWQDGDESIFSIDRRLERMGWAEADLHSGGRWWDRTWRESLTPESGGAPATARIERIGTEIELFRIGEIALTNEGKFNVGRLSLYLDDDRIYERIEQRTKEALFAPPRARSEANLARAVTTDKDRAEHPVKALADDRLDMSVGLLEDDVALDLERVLRGTSRERLRRPGGRFETPRGNCLTGEGWNVSVRPNLQLRLPGSMGTLQTGISRAELVVEMYLFPGETRQLWGILSLHVSTSPRDRELASATLTLEILRW